MAFQALQNGAWGELLKLSDQPQLRAAGFYGLGRWREAAELYRQLPMDSLNCPSLATCLFFLKDLPGAEQVSRQALELNPYDPRALYVQASLRASSELAGRLTSVCPNFLDGWVLKGRLLAEEHQLAEARQAVKEGLAIAPDHPALLRLAQELGVSRP